MVDSARVIWMDGELVAWADAKVHVLTHTLHYGLGVFEGIRAYRRVDGTTGIFRLAEHVARLLSSADLVGIESAFLPDQLEAACERLIVENDLGDAYLRPLIFIGDGAMALDAPDNPVRTLVAAWSFPGPPPPGRFGPGGAGLRVTFARHRARTALTSFPKAKLCGGYAMNVFAKRAAVLAGYDDAIILDERGHACEGTGQNLFAVERGRLVTPPLSAPILAGITRDTVMTLAREEGLVVLEEELPEDRLRLADEVFLTGTASELLPVSELSGKRVGAGGVGPLTRRLYDRYLATVRGEDDAHPEWVVKV
jgi:branched-chain amino acid aminotransferase